MLEMLSPQTLARLKRRVAAATLIALSLVPVGSNVSQPEAGAASSTLSPGAPYWIANPQGNVWNFGSAGDYGNVGTTRLNQPIVGISPTPTNKGYWLVARDGGIFSFGDAAYYGSTGAIKLNQPIVGMAPTPTNKGYWLVARDGGIFSFGDAAFYGSTGSIKLNQPIVGMAPTPTNRGYWLVASDGGIFSFGDAAFYGSAGAGSDKNFAKIISTPDGRGYWLLRNGGDALPYGSAVSASSTATGSSKRPAFALINNMTGPGDLAFAYAMGQRGKPYVWGGTGPNGYDCSGLTLKAWQLGGVTLPRIAADQYNFGTKVPVGNLSTGDLVFWADDPANPRTISHVALYIGNGNVVTASKTGDFVKTSTIWPSGLMPYGVRPR